MIDDPQFVFLFRLAYTLKKSIAEILTLPRWELESWRFLFDIYGPLDWKRDDLFDARATALQSVEKKPLKDYLLFGDPSFKEDPDEARARRGAALLKAAGSDTDN